MTDLAALALAALFAGFVDAIVGGGGLILVPALFSVFPSAVPATLLGTNKALGFDFLNASASAKLMNTATNIAALVLFAAKGHVWWHIALVMAVANIGGSLIGTRLALKHGAGFVRIGFIAVVSALILKTGWDAFLR